MFLLLQSLLIFSQKLAEFSQEATYPLETLSVFGGVFCSLCYQPYFTGALQDATLTSSMTERVGWD